MKLATIYKSTIVLLFLGTLSVNAQKSVYKGAINIKVQELQQEDDSLYVNIIFDARDAFVSSRNSVELTPVLVAPSQRMELPKMVIKGRNNFKSYNRSLSLLSKEDRKVYQLDPTYRLVKSYKDEQEKMINYQMVIPYQPWMADARLDLEEESCGCNGSKVASATELIAGRINLEKIIAPYEIIPFVAYIQPVAEPIKQRSSECEAFLDFPLGKSVILPEFGNNPTELAKINEAIDEVRGDNAATVRGVEITGFASPEGSTAFNDKLAANRAKALQAYLVRLANVPSSLYSVVLGGEDWAGLRKLVNESDLNNKQSVLFILDSAETPAQKKAKIAALNGGETYRYMLKEMYPSLRKVLLQIKYNVKQFDVTEAAEQIKTRPQNLSLNEMFLVANTFEDGSPEFIKVFETAVRIFPNDEIANLNAAASALTNKKTAVAERHLKMVKQQDLPEYINNLGVLFLLKGDYEKAKLLLEEALRKGVVGAKSNLEELQKKQENISLMSNKKRRN